MIAFFGEKYNPENVRVVEVPGFSAELCGGTHVRATGDIGAFKITEVTALSAGNRRIVALTGPKAIELFQESFAITKELSREFKVTKEQILDAINKQKEALKQAQTQIKQLRKSMWKTEIGKWIEGVATIGVVPFLFLNLDDYSAEELKEIATELNKKKPGFYFLISNLSDKSVFYAYLDPVFKDKLNMKNFSSWLKDGAGLQGGGSETHLQGGGAKTTKNLEEKIKEWILKLPVVK